MSEVVSVGLLSRFGEREIEWGGDAIRLRIAYSDGAAPRIALVEAAGRSLQMPQGLPLVDVIAVDGGHSPASGRLVHSVLGAALRYRSHRFEPVDRGEALVLTLADVGGRCEVDVRLQVTAGQATLHAQVVVRNSHPAVPLVLRSVSVFSTYLGAQPDSDAASDWVLHFGRNDWLGEGRWQELPLSGSAMPSLEQQLTGHNPRGQVRVAAEGTWSTGRYLPTAVLTSTVAGVAWAWQIEHNGPWRYDLGQDTVDRWFALSGPTDDDHQWMRVLAPGMEFETVPVTVAVGLDLETAIGELTRYRRSARRPHPDNAAMPVVFNDYMNTLNGDPTTARLEPLIDAAAAVGAEVFCIDAGWYADGFWWDSVGEWLPSQQRFPGGLGLVLDRIRDLGMVPGLWMEPEVIGVNSPIAAELPDAAFLTRHGQRVVEHDRYHLDLRHPASIAHLDEIVDRLVTHYGVGFFKFDYNINPGPGTDHEADSVGEGLLQHNRAHLAWLESVLDHHPHLVIENCGSGAMRSDFAMMSRLQMQSTSDQQDFLRYPPIAAAAPVQMLPEQAASWAYPQPEMSAEEVAFCLATGLLGRFYLSGYLNRMDDRQRDLVTDAIRTAKQFRTEIAASTPFWPLGLPGWDDETVAAGLRDGGNRLVTVWDRVGGAHVDLPMIDLAGVPVQVTTIFPSSLPSWTTQWDQGSGVLRVHNTTGQVGARVLRIRSQRSSD